MSLYAISRSASLTLPIRDRKIHYVPTGPNAGAVDHVDPAVAVNFKHAGYIPDYAKEAVSRMVDWGRGTGLNEDPFERCGSFDLDEAKAAEHWDDETAALVEEVLRAGSGSLYVVVDEPLLAKPWPNYDDITGDEAEAAKTIAQKVQEDGYSARDVAAYEQQNAARDEVLAVLDILIQEAEPDTLGVIQA